MAHKTNLVGPKAKALGRVALWRERYDSVELWYPPSRESDDHMSLRLLLRRIAFQGYRKAVNALYAVL